MKPHNIIVNLDTKDLELIDWGLAEFMERDRSYNVRVSSLHYKGPELFLNNTCYDFTLDSWGAGCVLGAMLFLESPIF